MAGTVGILADDLTGALDAGAGFCGTDSGRACGPVDYLSDPATAADRESIVLNSASRDMPDEGMAVRAALDLMGRLSGRDIVFKKVDSLMRGHVVAELAAIMRQGGFARCLFAPAFPAQGRVTEGGRQWLAEAKGRRTAVGPDLVDAFSAVGIEAAAISAATEQLPGRPVVWIGNASTDAELEALAGRMEGQGRVLYCGTAGLARVLGGGAPAWRLTPAGPVLAVIGSPHPVTRRQVEVLSRRMTGAGADTHIVAQTDEGALEERHLAGRMRILLPRLRAGISAADASRHVAGMIADRLPAISPGGTLLVTGGETLAQVIDTIAARRLRLLGEVQPGIPVSRIVGGSWDGQLLISKSGAFGDDGTLARLAGLDIPGDARGSCR